ncbi:MAG: L-serine ammonia-lyase, iron-sulfur-dependent, subunit alpha [Butyricicoccaceae bacterium]
MKYDFQSGKDLIQLCQAEQITIGEVMFRREMERSERTRAEIEQEMKHNLAVMKSSVQNGLDPERTDHGLFTGGDAVRLHQYAKSSLMGQELCELVAAAMAVVEVNSSMGEIVAAPTAGASGILPAALVLCGENRGKDEEEICMGLFAAGAIGCLIAENASIAGASGGCQAETGSAAAMAAGALAELCGADAETALTAAAIALKNILGLVCDPVGGLVECPCIKRNAIGTANAVLSCDLALAGIQSLIPFDEVVSAMKNVGCQMHSDLRETSKGGLAATETGLRLAAML